MTACVRATAGWWRAMTEVASRWQPIATAPVGKLIMLRVTNRWRKVVGVGYADARGVGIAVEEYGSSGIGAGSVFTIGHAEEWAEIPT